MKEETFAQYKRIKKYFASHGEEFTQEDYLYAVDFLYSRNEIDPTDDQIIEEVELFLGNREVFNKQ